MCNGETDFAITIWPEPHFRTFCELVEGEENKLTTFSTWTTMLGCNESNIIFQQHLCKLRSSNEEETKWPHLYGLRKKFMAATLSYFL